MEDEAVKEGCIELILINCEGKDVMIEVNKGNGCAVLCCSW